MTTDPRTFLDWDAALLPAAAAVLADTCEAGGVLQLDRVLIALPGARAGRRLKELLIAEAARREARLVPPRIITAGQLPELLYTPIQPLAEPELCRRIWAHQLRLMDASTLSRVFPRLPDRAELQQWLRLAAEVERLHTEVGAGLLTFRDVAGRCDDGLLFADGERWSVLAMLQDGYAAALDTCGRSDREISRRSAIASGGVSLEQELWLIGVPELSGAARAMLDLLVARQHPVRVLVHAPADMHEMFDGLGCVRQDAWRSAHIPLRDDQLHVVGHPSNQAERAVTLLARLDGRYAADEITIAVPDTEVVPYLEQRIRAAGIGARYAGGTPMERTGPAQLLAAMADCVATARPEAVASLLRHPDAAAWLTQAGVAEPDRLLTSLDEFITRYLPADLYLLPATAAGTPADDADPPRRDGAVRLIAAVLSRTLRAPFNGQRTVAEWMEPILGLLSDVYGAQQLNRRIPEQRRLIQVFTKIREVAAAHARVPQDMDDRCDAATAMRILLDDLRGQAVPLDAEEQSIELLGWLEMHLDDAPVAVLTGMNDPWVPESLNADAFLPNALRTRLGLDDNDRRLARYAYQLTAISASREVLQVIAGRRTLLGDPLRPSRLLLTGAGASLATRIESFLREDLTQLPKVLRDDVSSSSFALPPDRVIRFDPVDALSVTGFRAVIEDPYLFVLERVLRLRVSEDAARELQPPSFGNYAHEVMRRFGLHSAAACDDAAEVAAALDVLLDDVAEEWFGRAPLASVRVQTEQLRMRLHAYAACHARWVADGWRVVAVEAAAQDVPFVVDGVPFRIGGRVDRIDHNVRTGEWAVLDYKTGDRQDGVRAAHCTIRGDEITAWKDLQLPLYRHLLPHLVGDGGVRVLDAAPPPDALRFGYVLLCAEPEAVRMDLVQWSDAELEQADEAARGVVRVLRSGEVLYEPSRAWLEPDFELLLGRGRLVAAEDEEEELVAAP